MIFKGKPVKVIISGNAKKEFEDLNREVGVELLRGIRNSDQQILLRSIKQKVELLKENPEAGIHIAKNKIPKEYIWKYDANNIWKINLSGAWRMLYTIDGKEVEIIAVILDIVDHNEYDKKFGYRKR